MRLIDFERDIDLGTENELRICLGKRYKHAANAFWLADRDKNYPVMSILVKGDFATVMYFPNDAHPGFRSIGRLDELSPEGVSIFYFEMPDQEQEVPNEFVISFSDAMRVCLEFFQSRKIPQTIEWFEL